jgi:hypothetical protein
VRHALAHQLQVAQVALIQSPMATANSAALAGR